MRVIAGTAKGFRLHAPKGVQTRPTADRVKEAMFSILASSFLFENESVLDICAGTGSLGIEALSRGAGHCCFIEKERGVASILVKNLAATGMLENGEILTLDALHGISIARKKYQKFSLIFFDPPYRSNLYETVIPLLASENLLASQGILIVESDAKKQFEDKITEFFKQIDHRIYGDTALTFYSISEKI